MASKYYLVLHIWKLTFSLFTYVRGESISAPLSFALLGETLRSSEATLEGWEPFQNSREGNLGNQKEKYASFVQEEGKLGSPLVCCCLLLLLL